MKGVAIIGTSVLAIIGLLSFIATPDRGAAIAAESVSADEILVIVDEMGLRPSARVRQHGSHYIVQAVDPHGRELRVVADIHSGTIVSVAPFRESALHAPAYSGGPRIIQVPQADERVESRTIQAPRESGRRRGHKDVEATPRRMTSAPPPPPARPRTMLNSPGEDRALTPIYPTPRFDTGVEAMEKFGPHAEGAPATPD